MSYKLLIVDDEPAMVKTLLIGMNRAGYDCTTIASGTMAMNTDPRKFDAVIMDWSLPGKNGTEVIEYWRSRGFATPVLMLTARTGTENLVEGLGSGADDYVDKFFDWPVLLARIDALIRRVKTSGKVSKGLLSYDAESKRFFQAGKELDLGKREHDLLLELFENPNKTFSKKELIHHLYGQNTIYSNVIERHVKGIRNKSPKDPVETLHGFGYRLRS